MVTAQAGMFLSDSFATMVELYLSWSYFDCSLAINYLANCVEVCKENLDDLLTPY